MFNLPLIASISGSKVKSVCEVGVNEPDKCSVAPFTRNGAKTLLVEPLPWCVEHLRQEFPSATVIEAACGFENGTTILFDRGEGSWIQQVPAGMAPDEHAKHSGIKRDDFEEKYMRETRVLRFSDIDPGDLDVLCVDVEGAEWFVIEQMRSRPRMVRAETHFTHSGYKNPNLDKIMGHMAGLGYKVIGQDVSDTLWIL